MRATDGTLRLETLGGDKRRQVAARLAAVSIFFALAIGLFLMVRRAMGALSSPLPVPQLLAVATIVSTWAVSVRMLTSRNRLFVALTAVVLLMFAVGCSFPGTRLADWLAWGGALAVVYWPPMNWRGAAARPARHISSPSVIESDSEQVLQQLTRVRTQEGNHAIRGTLIGEFKPGERQATLHIAFCPPFERLPQVEVNVADDSDATVKLAQVLHNGVQLEVRIPQPATESASVAIELFATDVEPN